MIGIQVLQLPHAKGLPLPTYETAGAAGMDLRAAVAEDAPVALPPLARVLVPTGLQMHIPDHYEAQVRPRSGLAIRYGITCLNTPGTVDSDYRGEVQVILINLGEEAFTIRRGDRIAQMIICPVTQAYWEPVVSLTESVRSHGGFGSTGA